MSYMLWSASSCNCSISSLLFSSSAAAFSLARLFLAMEAELFSLGLWFKFCVGITPVFSFAVNGTVPDKTNPNKQLTTYVSYYVKIRIEIMTHSKPRLARSLLLAHSNTTTVTKPRHSSSLQSSL